MPEWAVAATLIGTRVTLKGGGIIERTGSGYRWNADGLDADELAVIPMVQPRAEHCGNCHGVVHADTRPLFVELGSDGNWVTETTGQLFSAQPIRLSALNLRDKDRLGQAWDLHAQRLVECRDCHYARTPPTQLMKDDNAALPEYSGEDLRTCDSCHSGGAGHDWLPEAQKHFAAIACETCHIPRLHLPARRQIDASVVTRAGDYLIDYRGLTQGDDPTDLARGYVAGYRPLLMQRQDADGVERWAPMNLVSRWFWVDGDSGDAVDQSTLRRAWLAAGGHRPEVVAVFDADGDGRVDAKELVLDQAQKVHLIRALLTGEGVAEPRLKAEVRAHHVHHSVTLQQATRACASCHEAPADATFDLATWVPGGVLPDTFVDVTPSIAQHWRRTPTGGLTITRPGPLSQARVGTGEDR
jgi:hypothetical protein